VVVITATLITGMPGCRSGSKGGYVAIEDDFPPYLKDLAEELDFYVGAAVGYGGNMYPNNQQYVEVLQREFNAVVAENVMKWQTIRWSESSYNFTPGDAIVAFAEENGMMVRGHTLAWHSQNPGWLQGKNYTREEAIEVLEDHITQVVTHWKGKIKEWDVVNEAVNDQGHRRTENVWQKWIGDDWIEIAFRAAHKADPDALLFYNDYSIEFLNSQKQNAVYNLIKDLVEKDVPIHGVGFQGHFGLMYGGAPDKAQLKASIDRFADLGLIVQFTEVDIRIEKPVTLQKLQQQAESYRRIFEAALEHPACSAVMIWGVHDGQSWVDYTFPNETAPLLFDNSFYRKQAYDAVRKALLAEIERRK